MKSEKMTPLLQSMWLQVLWILWTLWFVLDPAWDLFASGVEWLLSMGVLGWFLGLVALALAVSLFRTYGPAGGILSIMATCSGALGMGCRGPSSPTPISCCLYCRMPPMTISFFSSSGFRGGWSAWA